MSYCGRMVLPPEMLKNPAGSKDWNRTDPEHYYFRTAATFETGSEDLFWMNGIIALGSGRFVEGGRLHYCVHEVT